MFSEIAAKGQRPIVAEVSLGRSQLFFLFLRFYVLLVKPYCLKNENNKILAVQWKVVQVCCHRFLCIHF